MKNIALIKTWKKFVIIILLASIVVSSTSLISFAAEEEDRQRIMVSLGDSYSSGEGIEPFYGQDDELSDKLSNPDWLAHRSQCAWSGMLTLPSVDGKMSDNKGSNWFFEAASGAKTVHMRNEFIKDFDKGKTSGFYKLRPQLDVFDKLGGNKADYVTLTLGGNDAGFSNIISSCVTGSMYLDFGALSTQINDVWIEYFKDGGIRDNLYRAYNDIADKAGAQAQIIVAGYPQLINWDGGGVGVLPFKFSRAEAALVNNNVSKFNRAIESIVQQCRGSGMNICFVSVEEAFRGHEAYTSDPYINEVILLQRSQDLSNVKVASDYSIHPNLKGAQAYARCVQAKINELENVQTLEQPNISDERNIVLTLDVSGSMSGKPIEETRKAASDFINTVLDEDASIGIVTYDTVSDILSGFSTDKSELQSIVSKLKDRDKTNMEAGLRDAQWMLEKTHAKKKIIVLMSDGEPNVGLVGEDLTAYADEIKDTGTIIYTIGFFESLSDEDRASAQYLMESIASDGCHYEVASADQLVFFFEDMADQINGQKYIYVRIACPVDVSVAFEGETLDSSENNLSERTSFGTLTFEENLEKPDSGANGRIKVLRLKEGANYDLKLTGTGHGIMNYTIGFMDNNGDYSDLRKFENIKITRRTRIDTVASNSDDSILNIDEDGDGKYDIRFKAKANGYGKEITSSDRIVYVIICAVIFILLDTVVIIMYRNSKKKKGE